jgi:hypothetical protein
MRTDTAKPGQKSGGQEYRPRSCPRPGLPRSPTAYSKSTHTKGLITNADRAEARAEGFTHPASSSHHPHLCVECPTPGNQPLVLQPPIPTHPQKGRNVHEKHLPSAWSGDLTSAPDHTGHYADFSRRRYGQEPKRVNSAPGRSTTTVDPHSLERRQGILVTQLLPDTYSVEVNEAVLFGVIQEKRINPEI